MGVYNKDMEMPRCCSECAYRRACKVPPKYIRYSEYDYIAIMETIKRYDNCPLVEREEWYMKNTIYRIVEVDIDGDVVTFEVEQPADMNEDEFYEMVCDYVLSHINITVL